MTTLIRTAMVVALLTVVSLASAGCEEPGQAESDKILQAWRRAGLTPTVFTPLESQELAPGVCRQGEVDGLTTMLCRYADLGAARSAQAAGLARVGDATGLAIAAGTLLLIVIDSDPNDPKDPSGRTLNQIATLFRDTQVPPPDDQADNRDRADGEGSTDDNKADDPADDPADAGRS